MAIGGCARGRSMVEHGLLAASVVWINTENDPWVVQETLIKVKPSRAQVKDGSFRTREEKEPLEEGDDVCEKIEHFVKRLEDTIRGLPFTSTVLLLFGVDSLSVARYYYDLSRVTPTLLEKPWKEVRYIHGVVPFVLGSDYVRAYLNTGLENSAIAELTKL